MKQTEAPVVVQQLFDGSIERVWRAVTELDEMKLWYFDNIDAFNPEVGSKSRFTVQSGERRFTHLWKITEVDAPYKIVYNWKYEEYQGDSFVSFVLKKEGLRTKLTLTLTVTEDFDDSISEFKRESCVGGWEYLICRCLAEYIEKR